MNDPRYILIENYGNALKKLYFSYYECVLDANYEDFKKNQLDITEYLMDKIHNKYCDHVESFNKEIK